MQIENYEYTTITKYDETVFRFSKAFKTFDELESWLIEKNILTSERPELLAEWNTYKPQGRSWDNYIIDKYNNDGKLNLISRYCKITDTYQAYGFLFI